MGNKNLDSSNDFNLISIINWLMLKMIIILNLCKNPINNDSQVNFPLYYGIFMNKLGKVLQLLF